MNTGKRPLISDVVLNVFGPVVMVLVLGIFACLKWVYENPGSSVTSPAKSANDLKGVSETECVIPETKARQ